MLNRRDSSASGLMVTARNGQFGGGGGCGIGTVTMATSNAAAATLNDVQHLELLVIGAKRADTADLAVHNNNKTALVDMSGSSGGGGGDEDPTSPPPPPSRRRRSSGKSARSLLSASLHGSHKDQVGTRKKITRLIKKRRKGLPEVFQTVGHLLSVRLLRIWEESVM